MARPLRVEYAGAVYHVMARGNQGQRVCTNDQDRRLWVATLVQAWSRTGWRIHAWTLMPNHYHLLVETPEPNLVSGMKWLQSAYTQRYNARHRKRSHLFQGRYRALPVESESLDYFQTVSTYIHLNPERAKLIRIGEDKLWEYPWSSYPDYVRQPPPEWLVTERVLGSLGLGAGERPGYEAYLESRVLELGIRARRKELEAGWEQLRRGWYVGGKEFRSQLLKRAAVGLAGRRPESHAGAWGQAHDQSRAEEMLAAGLRLLQVSGEDLAGLPKGQLEKQVLAWWLRANTTVSRRWLAERLTMGFETRASQAASFVENSRNPAVLALKEKLTRYEI